MTPHTLSSAPLVVLALVVVLSITPCHALTVPNPSGSKSPFVPANTTLAEELQSAFASGLLTPAQVKEICSLKLGVYSYYWAAVGDPLQRVRTVYHTRALHCPVL